MYSKKVSASQNKAQTNIEANSAALNTETLQGTIIASHGKHYMVRSYGDEKHTENPIWVCTTRGKKHHVCCGDKVVFSPNPITSSTENINNHQGVIEEVLERSSIIYRADGFKRKMLAANVDQLLVMIAPEPTPNPSFLLRTLLLAEANNIPAIILANKSELKQNNPWFLDLLDMYSQHSILSSHYPITELANTHQGEISPVLNQLLEGKCSVIVGQSGMGKSTLINALIPQANIVTQSISLALHTGKHTTTYAALYDLPNLNAQLIDTPGFQECGLAHLGVATLANHFVDFQPYLGGCRFNNCLHKEEPSCAIKAAVAEENIHPKRYADYLAILHENEYAERVVQDGASPFSKSSD